MPTDQLPLPQSWSPKKELESCHVWERKFLLHALGEEKVDRAQLVYHSSSLQQS